MGEMHTASACRAHPYPAIETTTIVSGYQMHECQDHLSNSGGAVHHRGADGATVAGQCSCTSLISRAFPHLWPRGAEISFCHTIDHCRTILYYTVLFLDLAPRQRYCRLFTLLFEPGGLPGSQTLTSGVEAC